MGFGREGGYRVLSKLADEWISHGCRVAFLAPCWSDPQHYPTNAAVYWVDAAGRDVGQRLGTSTIPARLSAIRMLRALQLGIRRIPGPWDVVLANHSFSAWPVALARTTAAKAYYIQAYEPEIYESRTGLKSVIQMGLSWASYFLPLHRTVNAPIYLNYRSCRARSWVPPGIDLDVFHSRTGRGSTRAERTANGLTVGCIGRHNPEKGARQVIEAYREFARRAPGAHRFRVADFGVPPDWLEGVPGLERVVPQNDSELADYYRSIDVLLALGTVQHGAFHYPVLEAMASGVPVITTGYLPADPSNAWIVGADPGEAAAALEEVFASPDLASARTQLAEAATRHFGWPTVGRRFLDHLRTLSTTAPNQP